MHTERPRIAEPARRTTEHVLLNHPFHRGSWKHL